MTVVLQPSSKRFGQLIAEGKNVGDTLTTQQQSVVTAPGGAVVVQDGVIPATPAGTPGPAGARYGMQFFDSAGVLQVQIDQYGWHLYTNTGGTAVYASELVTYS
jgi:hypothetical protein